MVIQFPTMANPAAITDIDELRIELESANQKIMDCTFDLHDFKQKCLSLNQIILHLVLLHQKNDYPRIKAELAQFAAVYEKNKSESNQNLH